MQTHFRATTIELGGNTPIGWRIQRIVAVEQIEWYGSDLCLPGPQDQGSSRKIQFQSEPLTFGIPNGSNGQLRRIIVGVELHLPATVIQALAKIPLLPKNPNSYQGNPQISSRLEDIASKDPQPPRVDGEGLGDSKLHTEIGNASAGSLWIFFLKPAGPVMLLASFLELFLQQGKKICIVSQAIQFNLVNILQYQPGVPRTGPEIGVDLFP